MSNFTLDKIDENTGEVTGAMSLEVRAYPIKTPKGSTKGYASVTVDGMFGAHGIGIVEGKNGLFVTMPQTKDAKGGYRDIFHPVTAEVRKALQDAVLSEFGDALDEMITQQESTVQKLRDAASAAKEKTAPAAAKEPKNKKRSGPEL
jgi:stage V sporulation protein G